jgi:hypothetical protein
MELLHLPLLRMQRELYTQPRGLPRFHEYLARMIRPDGELRLPLVSMNPLGKEHLAQRLDEWLALGAEELAREAIEAAEIEGPGQLQVALVLADDVAGGWTNRYTTDFAHRFESQGLLARDFAVGLLWASEEPRAEVAAREALLSIARAAWQRTHGFGKTLRDLLAQECFAKSFAGEEVKPMPADHLDATDAPTLFAALYGDDAAVSLGYSPLGVEPAL